MAYPGAHGAGGAAGGRERFPPLLARERARRSSGADSLAPDEGAPRDCSSSDSGGEPPRRAWRRGGRGGGGGSGAAAEPWGAASLPILSPPPPPAPPSPVPSSLLSQLHVPVGIGVPGSTATIPVRAQSFHAAAVQACRARLLR
jgi:hypothetical protein